jgi:hypothetical protein
MRTAFIFLVACLLCLPGIISAQTLTQVRVYFDGNDEQSQYFAVASLASINQPFTIDVSVLPRGMHTLYVEVKDNNGRWSLYDHDNIHIWGGLQMATLNACEYFFDSDPGFGEGIQIPLSASTVNDSYDLDLTGLSNGVHVAYVRVRDGVNQWSLYAQRVFQIVGSMQEELVEAEYFFNSDPGLGNGQPISLSNLAFEGSLELSVAGLPNGVHTLYMRVKDARGIWSLFSQHNILVTNAQPGTTLIYAEYYFDSDPGQGNAIPLVVPQSSVINGNFSITLPANLTGTHSICTRVQDINGQWSNTECETITICNAQAPQIAVVGQNCQSNPFVLTATPGYDTYTWSNGLMGQSISVTEPGVYSVNVVSNGCAAYASQEVQFDFLPPASFTTQGGVCEGDVQTLSIANVYDNIVWQDGQTSSFITVTQSGVYTVEVSNGACTSSFSAEVSFVVPDGIVITTDGSSCEGDALTLSIDTEYTNIVWSNGGFSASTVVLQSGVYTVNALEQGCATQGSITVDFTTPPVIEISQTGGSCEGEEVVLSVPAGYDAYVWSEGSTNATQSVTTSGNYGVTITEGSCSVSQSIDVQLTQVDVPAISQNVNVLACDVSVATAYQWYLNGAPISGANAQFYSASESGFYTVEVEINSCSATSALYSFSYTMLEEVSSDIVRLYPNPCDDYVIVDAGNTSIDCVEVFDGVGKLVHTQKASSPTIRLSTVYWSTGLYTVRLLDGRGALQTRRFEKH